MLRDLLRVRRDEVIDAWASDARRAAAARGLSRPEFQNIVPSYLEALAQDGYALGTCTGRPKELLEAHFSTRVRQGFQLAEILDELRLLAESIAAVGARQPDSERPSTEEMAHLFGELQLASVIAAELFASHMREEEQLEKRYRRLIQSAVRVASRPDPSALREGLEAVLSLVMEAMGAQSAALMLFEPRTERLDLAAATGLARDAVYDAVTELRPSSFVAQVARSEATTQVLDAATTPLEVNDVLRRSGIHALLGMRLPPRHALVGVLYIGLTQARAFSAREVSRLVELGDQLTLHLDNARLFEELRAEREAREQTVSMIAHDLRGPLASARVAAQLLARVAASSGHGAELATRVERNIDRIDRMLRDLLDVRRLHTGEGLRVLLAPCDLGAIARAVVEELREQFADRIELSVEGDVRGHWSEDELRRAIWNLAANALKYGAEHNPIEISVRGDGDVRVSVHNEGAPIAVEDIPSLFEPFRRSRVARAGSPSGWGLGLALVRGVAEAHGGSVHVESTAERGTTFTIDLPRDARRFQPRAPDENARASIPSAPP